MIRILFLGANPSDTTRVSIDREMRAIAERLSATPLAGQFALEQAWAVRTTDLQKVLLAHQPDIVHFSGHAEAGAGDGGAILVEGPDGNAVPIAAEELEELLRLVGGVRIVVLNACDSAVQCDALRRQVDCVVGMTAAIDDRASIAFSWAFYQALGYGKSVQAAFDLGRLQIGFEGLPGKDIPRLAERDGVDPGRIHLAELRRPRWRRLAAVAAGVLALGAAGFGLYRAVGHGAPSPIDAPIDGAHPIDASVDAIDGALPPPPDGMVRIAAGDVPRGDPDLADVRARCASVAGARACRVLQEIQYWQREPGTPFHVDAFLLDRTEVTVGAFVAWLERAGARVVGTRIEVDGVEVAGTGLIEVAGEKLRALEGYQFLPIVDVTWRGAQRYCEDEHHGTLPTGAQWERAARGTTGHRWPWGDDPPACADAVLARREETVPTGRLCPGTAMMEAPGAGARDRTDEGVLDLIGNVSEWVLDAGPDPGFHEVRGGSYADTWIVARPTGRTFWQRREQFIGFRCAAAITPGTP